jgi:small subunit ribosomal protein S20
VPQIKSQKKRVLTNEKKRLANNAKKSAMRTAVKRVLTAVEAADKESAVKYFDEANKHLDKLVAKNIYHRNYAARQKARLAKAINTLN